MAEEEGEGDGEISLVVINLNTQTAVEVYVSGVSTYSRSEYVFTADSLNSDVMWLNSNRLVVVCKIPVLTQTHSNKQLNCTTVHTNHPYTL